MRVKNKNKNGSNGICMNFCGLNKIVTDVEHIPDPEKLLQT